MVRWDRVDRIALHLSQDLYAGWTPMAFFVHVATVVQATGAPVEGIWGTAWQLLVIAAAGTAVFFVVFTGGSWWSAAAAGYALVGAAISSGTSGYVLLAITLGNGVLLLLGSTLTVRAVDRRSGRGRPRASTPRRHRPLAPDPSGRQCIPGPTPR